MGENAGAHSLDKADRYRQLFEESTAAQLVVDERTGRIVEANRAAADFYGLPRASLEGVKLEALGVDDPTALADALEVGAAIGVHLVGLSQRHASGERRLVELYGTPLSHDGPPPRLVHLILHDITERARAQERERDFVSQLAQQDDMQRQATMSRMGELVAGVAHEVRNPLFALSSALDALRQRLGTHPDFARYAPLISGQVDRLSALMGDLLDFGRPAALNRREVGIDDLLAATVDVTRPLADKAEVVVESRNACDAARTVPVDRFRFVGALQNLLANAIQHSAPAACVVLSARDVDRGVAVEFIVTDSGPGFDPTSLPNVFEPFFTKRPGGTGLGLALVHRAVHDHGGLVFAENRPVPPGAQLRIRIPTTPPAPSPLDR